MLLSLSFSPEIASIIFEVRFSDMFPISLSGLSFNQQATDIDYLSASVTMKYRAYEFALKGKSATVITS